MMLSYDPDELSLTLELTDEPAELDLTRGLGAQILDFAVEEMIACHARQCGPEGAPWKPLARSTVQAKGSAAIGVKTGTMLDPGRWRGSPRDLEPRRASWIYDYGELRRGTAYYKAWSFHNGNPQTVQPPRPLVGWTQAAQKKAADLIAQSVAALRGE